MKRRIIIAAAVLLALLAAAGILISIKQKNDPPPVRIIEDTSIDNEIINSQDVQIADLHTQIDELERRMAQQEFDYSALKSEKDQLESRSKDLEGQNSWLRGRNNTLSSSEKKLKDDIAALNEELARLSQERDASEAAYQEALAKIEEIGAKAEAEQAALNEELARLSQERDASEAAYQEDSAPETKGTEDTVVSASESAPLGQSRNIIGIKAGEADIDVEGAFAIMPHWFLVTEIGLVDAPDDFLEQEFPGLTADHAFMFTTLFGTGLNWRFNSLQGQPNFYIETMLGPAMYRYVIKDDDDKGINTYLLWRSAVGFDLTLYKNLQFTTEVGLDYIINCEFTPRVTIGLQYNFSNNWALFRKKSE